MKFNAFALDQWLQQHASAEFNLGGSTGPRWKVRDLLALVGDAERERVLDLELTYPPIAGALSLREAIAEMQHVHPDEVVVLAGSAEALFHVFYLAAEPGANVIIPSPCFPSHEMMPESLGFELRHYHLRRENSYAVDLDEVKHLADRNTKILVVNSPHNPTGATLSNEEMHGLCEFASSRGIQLLCDEVFHPIYHGRKSDSAARHPHATVVGDFSKAFALPGLRLGWIIERNPARRAAYLNAREYISVSNTLMGEFLGEIAIRHREQVLGRTQEVASANLLLLDQILAQHRDVIDWVRPQGGMTGFARLVSGEDARGFCEFALSQGLLLAPGDCWDVADHFRIGFGVGPEWYGRAMERFSDIVRAWPGNNTRPTASKQLLGNPFPKSG